MGIQRAAVETARALPKIFAASVRRQIQNADARRARPERLPARCERRLPTLHHAATIKDPVEDVVFPGRRSLGAQTTELAVVVQNRERLGGSVVRSEPVWPLTEGVVAVLVLKHRTIKQALGT